MVMKRMGSHLSENKVRAKRNDTSQQRLWLNFSGIFRKEMGAWCSKVSVGATADVVSGALPSPGHTVRFVWLVSMMAAAPAARRTAPTRPPERNLLFFIFFLLLFRD